ncbi:MAG: transcriptional regulator [Thaumarchaeota archaeon]|nr:MAG: transcriptional regulator [Nitrososphaerota archaeon]
MPTAYVLINSDLGTDESIISKIKEILKDEKDVEFTTQGVYGIYDIVLKISSDNTDVLRNIITYKIRKINKVQSTLTMMVVEEQEKSD